MAKSLSAGKWFVECAPGDGGRIVRLSYDGVELLTAPPTRTAAKVPPRAGPFERKPVFGYDDCFPTVDVCAFPRDGKPIGDHGELVYEPWSVSVSPGKMVCRTKSPRVKARFVREIRISGNRLAWRFEVENTGRLDLPFLHAMHGLMPLEDVTALEFPEFDESWDESGDKLLGARTGKGLARLLLDAPVGYAKTLLLRGMKSGTMSVTLRGRVTVKMTQPVDVMPNMAIWWNRRGHPGGAGKGRSECAFEPIAGRWSTLDRSAATGSVQVARPGERVSWKVVWEAVEA